MERTPHHISRTLATAVLCALAAWSAAQPPRARACGGFFCSSGGPVNQAAERILFAQDADGRVTMIVEIAYTGPSHEFAWILPVPGEPLIGVSSSVVFQRLQAATNPSYTLNMRVEGECRSETQSLGGRGFANASGDPGGGDDFDEGVDVRAQGTVGPYDYVLIAVTDAAALDDPAQLAIDWLGDNGYDVAATGPEVLRPYLDDGLNLLAFRLTKGSGTGSIRPVQLTFESGLPSIPIRPTAVAATEDMGVMVWVVGDGRAIPKNYKHLELNEALINWFNPGSTYNDVVTMAADEAMGQGFVTEYAGPGDDLADGVYGRSDRDSWNRLSVDSFSTGSELFGEARDSFFGWDGFDQAVVKALAASGAPAPTADELATCPECLLDDAQVTPTVMHDAIFDSVIEPVQVAAELLTSAPRVTRLYTTMSASEMTLDPVFDLNDDLPDYSNVHTADWVIECRPSITMDEATWRIELESGDVRGKVSAGWPIDLQDAPASQRIVQLGTRGAGEVVLDNTKEISAAVKRSNARYPSPGCGCSVPGPADGSRHTAGLAALLLLGLCATRVLRRRA
jgi:MYXO-CTERM domain-containing protein